MKKYFLRPHVVFARCSPRSQHARVRLEMAKLEKSDCSPPAWTSEVGLEHQRFMSAAVRCDLCEVVAVNVAELARHVRGAEHVSRKAAFEAAEAEREYWQDFAF